jgi:hypothetical protein
MGRGDGAAAFATANFALAPTTGDGLRDY